MNQRFGKDFYRKGNSVKRTPSQKSALTKDGKNHAFPLGLEHIPFAITYLPKLYLSELNRREFTDTETDLQLIRTNFVTGTATAPLRNGEWGAFKQECRFQTTYPARPLTVKILKVEIALFKRDFYLIGGNKSIYLRWSGPLLESGLDRPEKNAMLDMVLLVFQHFHICCRGGWSQSFTLKIFFLALWVVVVVGTIRAQIYTCSFVCLGELFFEMLAVTATAFQFRGVNYNSIQFAQVKCTLSGSYTVTFL